MRRTEGSNGGKIFFRYPGLVFVGLTFPIYVAQAAGYLTSALTAVASAAAMLCMLSVIAIGNVPCLPHFRRRRVPKDTALSALLIGAMITSCLSFLSGSLFLIATAADYKPTGVLLATFAALTLLAEPICALIDSYLYERSRVLILGLRVTRKWPPGAAQRRHIDTLMFALLRGYFIAFALSVLFLWATRGTMDDCGVWPRCIYVHLLRYTDLAKSVIAVGGLTCVMRLTRNSLKAVDRNYLSWFATLLCYPPLFFYLDEFVGGLERKYVWTESVGENGVAFGLLTGLLIALALLYASDVLVWGGRWGNLCIRGGVITSGPFALMRHPAYFSKCAMFWIEGFPLYADTASSASWQCFQLLAITILYYARARMEDRHLRMNKLYIAYELQLRERRACLFRAIGFRV